MEDIGLVAVDNAGKACSSPTEEHVLVASSCVCELRPFVVVAVRR